MNKKVCNIIQAPGRKKILALDGGGTRGCITVEILANIETMLKEELQQGDDFVLADYFDFITGTSIGAIFACYLSLGTKVEQLRFFFKDFGKMMFERNSLLNLWRAKYDSKNLAVGLQKNLGADTLLGSSRLNTLLMLVMRNASTDSPWPVTNNPFALYNNREMDGCNLDLPIWQLIRASTAAPTFFPPEKISIGNNNFLFEDGAISTYNNPSFLSFLQTTMEPYKINWQAGEKDIFLVSVGNGNCADQQLSFNPLGKTILKNAMSIPGHLLHAALNEQDMLCRVFGKCLHGHELDSEIGTLIGKQGPASPKLFTYLRYDFETSRKYLDSVGLHDLDVKIIKQLASVDHIPDLQKAGKVIGENLVDKEHFQDFLFLNTNHDYAGKEGVQL
jgi:patatin-like phospholipase/acyl hydrolase